MQALVALRVPIDQEHLHRLARLAPEARDWSEALQWVLDAYEVLTHDDQEDEGWTPVDTAAA